MQIQRGANGMIKENQRLFNLLLVLGDAIISIFSMLLSYHIRFDLLAGESNAIELVYYMQLMLVAVPAYFLIYHYFGLHETYRHKTLTSEIGKVMEANLVGIIFIFVLAFFLKEVNISRMVILLFGGINFILSSIERIILRKLLRYLRRKGYNLKHLLLVGWNEAAGEFFDKISTNKNLGYRIDGYISGQKEDVGGRDIPYSGDFSRLQDLLAGSGIDEVVISLDYDEFPHLGDIIDICEKSGVKSSLLPFYTKYLPTRPYIDEIEGMPLINLRRVPLDNPINSFVKRSFDILASGLGLLILSPLLLVIAVGVRCTSPGPIIYRQQRIGRNKKPFTMYKFRSMQMDDRSDMTTWGTQNDSRRTKFGVFLRKYSIDELPQLFNVLKGDMSLVGPRPERPFFVGKFKEEIPLYMMKHLVRPGITGWAQIHGWRGDTSILERIKCDIFYIENWTFFLDIKILILTVFKGFINHAEE